jgi:putative NADH-flavin reductase
MTVTIFGATGLVGKQLITHVLAKGWTAKAFGRNTEQLIDRENAQFKSIKGYVFSEEDVAFAIKGSDAVLSALGGAFDGSDKSRSLGIKNIIAAMDKQGVKRIVALGGMGVLPDASGGILLDAEDYPSEYIPVGLEHKQAYEYLRDSDLDWTFLASPNILDADADNNFVTKAEEHTGGGEINAGNLALFMVEELERNEYVRKRVGISNVTAVAGE